MPRAAGLAPGAIAELQRRTATGWKTIKARPADAQGAVAFGYVPRNPSPRYELRLTGIAFGNLECVISDRGAPVPKRFNFRGRARDLTAVVRFAGLDVLNLASENARQRAFAQAALNAGASAVIGAHPHVLQPVRRLAGRRLIAYSLGNFVWSAGSAATTRTAILRLGLSPRGVQSSTLLPAVIEATRPRLLG